MFKWPFFTHTGKYNVLIRSAEEAKNYIVIKRILLTLLGVLVSIVALTYIITILYSKYGSFTVSINKSDSVQYSLTLSEDKSFKNQIVRLNSKAATEITNISVNDLPKDLDSINGEHNGANNLAYTFYLKNVGKDTVDYEYNMFIANVKNNVDKAIRIRLYVDGKDTTYARTRSDGTGPEPDTTEFATSKVVTRTKVRHFSPGDVTKFTVVIWLEGDDPDCINDLIDGALKTDMTITVVEAKTDAIV